MTCLLRNLFRRVRCDDVIMQYSRYPMQQYVADANGMADGIFHDLYRHDLGCPLQRLMLCLRNNQMVDGCSLCTASDYETGAVSDVTVPASLNELICREYRVMAPPLFDETGICVDQGACLHFEGSSPMQVTYYLLMPVVKLEGDDLLWLTMHRRTLPFTVDELVTCQIALHKSLRLSK